MGLFDNVGETSVARGGSYFKPGSYVVAIQEVKATKNRKGDACYIVSAKAIESDCDAIPVGAVCSQVISFKHDAALSNVKAFVAACLGIDPQAETARADAEVTTELCEQSCSDAQPFEGLVMNLTCVNIKTQTGGDFTLHQWAPTEESIVELAEGTSA